MVVYDVYTSVGYFIAKAKPTARYSLRIPPIFITVAVSLFDP